MEATYMPVDGWMTRSYTHVKFMKYIIYILFRI